MTFTLKLVFYLLIVCVPTKMHSSLEAYPSDADSAFKNVLTCDASKTEIIIAREVPNIKNDPNIWHTVRKYANKEYTIETINTFPFTINIAKNKCVGQFDLNEQEISSIINHCFPKKIMLYREDEEYYSIENNIVTCFTKKNNALNNSFTLEMRKQESTCTTYLIPCCTRNLYGTFTEYTDKTNVMNNDQIIIQGTDAYYTKKEHPTKVKIKIGTKNRVTYINIGPIYLVADNDLVIFSEVKSNQKNNIYTLDMYEIRCPDGYGCYIRDATHKTRLIFESDKKWTLFAVNCQENYFLFTSKNNKNEIHFYYLTLGIILENVKDDNILKNNQRLPFIDTKILYYSSLKTKDIFQDSTITDEFLKETLNELTLDSTVTESDKQYKKIVLSFMNPEKYSLTHFDGPSHSMYTFEALKETNLNAILRKFTEKHDVLTMDRIKNICATVNQIMDLLIPNDKKNTTLQELDTCFLNTIEALINAKDVATFSTHKQSFIDKIGHFYIDSLQAPLLKLLQNPDGFFISPNDVQESEALDELHDNVITQNNTIKECIARSNILTKPIFKANNQATNNELYHTILSNISNFLYAYYKEDNFVTFEMSIQRFIDQNSNNIEPLIKLEDLLLTASDINNVHERAHKIHKITHTLEFLKKHATILSQYYLPPTSSAILRLSLESLTIIIGYLLFSYLNKGHIILGALPATLLLINNLSKWKHHILNEFNLSRQCKKFSDSVDNLDKILKKTCEQFLE